MKVSELIEALTSEDPSFEVMLMGKDGFLLKIAKVEPWFDLSNESEQRHLVMIVGEKG